jgi:hypothetical protein
MELSDLAGEQELVTGSKRPLWKISVSNGRGYVGAALIGNTI